MNGGLSANPPPRIRSPAYRHSGAGRNPEPRWTPACRMGREWIQPFPPPLHYTVIITAILIVIPAKAGIHTPAIVTPGFTGVLDSGLRRNDDGGGWPRQGWRGMESLPHPTLSRWERAFPPAPKPFPSRHSRRPTVIPAAPPSFRRRPESRTPVDADLQDGQRMDTTIPASPTLHRHYYRHPYRHSRESGNPHPGLSPIPGKPGFWIPACAGMTVGADGLGKVGGVWSLSLTQPSPAGRGLFRQRPNRSPAAPPSFRRRPESRTPVDAGLLIGGVWIPAFAGMTMRLAVFDGVVSAGSLSLTQPSPAGRGLSGGRAYRA